MSSFRICFFTFTFFGTISSHLFPSLAVAARKEYLGSDVEYSLREADLKAKYPYYLSGFAKDGSPVWIVEWGKWDVSSTVDKSPEDEQAYDKYVQSVFAEWAASPKKYSTPEKPIEKYAAILDAAGYGSKQSGDAKARNEFFRNAKEFKATNEKSNNFKNGYIINSDFLFSLLWTVARPMAGPSMENVDVYGTNSAQWKKVLVADFGAQALPKKYGGSNEDPKNVS